MTLRVSTREISLPSTTKTRALTHTPRRRVQERVANNVAVDSILRITRPCESRNPVRSAIGLRATVSMSVARSVPVSQHESDKQLASGSGEGCLALAADEHVADTAPCLDVLRCGSIDLDLATQTSDRRV